MKQVEKQQQEEEGRIGGVYGNTDHHMTDVVSTFEKTTRIAAAKAQQGYQLHRAHPCSGNRCKTFIFVLEGVRIVERGAGEWTTF